MTNINGEDKKMKINIKRIDILETHFAKQNDENMSESSGQIEFGSTFFLKNEDETNKNSKDNNIIGNYKIQINTYHYKLDILYHTDIEISNKQVDQKWLDNKANHAALLSYVYPVLISKTQDIILLYGFNGNNIPLYDTFDIKERKPE